MDTEPLVRDETVTLDGLRFHYRDWGEPTAPPVVLLHAYLQHARTWDTIAKGLANGSPVSDRPGNCAMRVASATCPLSRASAATVSSPCAPSPD